LNFSNLSTSMTERPTPTFATPPIVELVLGAQFSPLTKLTSGHFGLLWNELGSEWNNPSDGPVFDDQYELFDRPKWGATQAIHFHLEPIRLPGRFVLEHQSGDRLIQVQSTRFHLNWRKRVGFYPSYKKLIHEFESTFARFADFTERSGLGRPAVNQWELTYIDSFPQGEYWKSPVDWSDLLPGLFGNLFPTEGLGVSLEHRGAEWSYEIEPKKGRLHVAARPGWWGDDGHDSLLLQMTARGPVGKDGSETLRQGFDIGHRTAVGAFLRIVDRNVQQRWGEE
jgi:uncharacterized protein (TIGR04255 family)